MADLIFPITGFVVSAFAVAQIMSTDSIYLFGITSYLVHERLQQYVDARSSANYIGNVQKEALDMSRDLDDVHEMPKFTDDNLKNCEEKVAQILSRIEKLQEGFLTHIRYGPSFLKGCVSSLVVVVVGFFVVYMAHNKKKQKFLNKIYFINCVNFINLNL